MLPGVRTVITDSTYRLTAPSIERHHRAHGVIVGSSETNGTFKLDDAMTPLNLSLGPQLVRPKNQLHDTVFGHQTSCRRKRRASQNIQRILQSVETQGTSSL